MPRRVYAERRIPEALTIGVVVLLSSVAVGFYSLRKNPKTGSYSLGKTGKIN